MPRLLKVDPRRLKATERALERALDDLTLVCPPGSNNCRRVSCSCRSCWKNYLFKEEE